MLSIVLTAMLSIAVNGLGQPFRIESIKGYPFPTELTASSSCARIAGAFDERGGRNIHVAESPGFKARKLTSYANDDGQELTSVSISSDGKWVVFVRGGEHGSN